MDNIFSVIKRDHILKAIKEIDETGIRKGRHSSTYDLIYNGKPYPPKLVISIAARFATGQELNSDEFEGGETTTAFKVLREQGFTIEEKTIAGTDPWIQIINSYKSSIKARGNSEELYKWRLIKENYGRFDFTEEDIDKTIRGIKFLNLVYHNGIAALYHLTRSFPVEIKACFLKLFNESENLEMRISEFTSTTMQLYRKIEPKLSHHQDERSIATYLTFKYPDRYTLYKDSFYQELCKRIKEPAQKPGKKYAHYLKLVNKFISEYIRKDADLLKIKSDFLTADCYEDNNNLIFAQDILYQVIDNPYNDSPSESKNENSTIMKTALNTILFGPPGTGKTYGTMEHSVRIIENLSADEISEKYKTREEIRARYLKYVNDKQIAFTTFHQSFSYEDFIEGIKPVMPSEIAAEESDDLTQFSVGIGDDENKLEYHIEPGIFKLISDEARSYNTFVSKGVKWVRRPSEKELNSVQFFKMSLGNTLDVEDNKIYNYCIKEGCIALGYGDDIDFTGVKNRADIITRFRENQVVLKDKNDFRVSAVERFMFWMKENDLVLISLGNHRLRAVGRIMKEGYYFNPNSGTGYNQFRNVEWLMIGQEVPVAEVYQKGFSQQTIYVMYDDKIKKEFFTGDATKEETDQTKRNHVLIIDEINRGNIANIFGELITLIEDDKREGAEEALSVKLPYSKKQFSVPSNLYILGTMNTADKSVEALDAALRRRFTFIETAPAPHLLNNIGEKSINYLYAKYAELAWKNEKWITIENDLINLIVNKESYTALTEDYDNLPGKKSEPPTTWNLGLVIQICNKRGIEFIDFQKMLKAVNNRIEKLLDKDHRIGHAYFINLYKSDFPFTELKSIFLNKILPLLQEYFFGDHGKIGLVLGDSFVVRHTEANADYSFAKFKGYNEDTISELKERAVFKFTDSKTWTTETFTSIYQ
jgi:5-methylcytosine-specific restriction protein B